MVRYRLLSPSRGERLGERVSARRVWKGLGGAFRALRFGVGVFTLIPGPSPLEGEGRCAP